MRDYGIGVGEDEVEDAFSCCLVVSPVGRQGAEQSSLSLLEHPLSLLLLSFLDLLHVLIILLISDCAHLRLGIGSLALLERISLLVELDSQGAALAQHIVEVLAGRLGISLVPHEDMRERLVCVL